VKLEALITLALVLSIGVVGSLVLGQGLGVLIALVLGVGPLVAGVVLVKCGAVSVSGLVQLWRASKRSF
jgi:UPF0716 family protein affecting phage T7 exclusion